MEVLKDRSSASQVLAALAGTDAPPRTDGPFLSVIVRTQGRRPESLRDSLLCLAAQDDQDFEVLLVVHNGDSPATLDAVRDLVTEETPQLLGRVKYLTTSGPSPSRPLNEAIIAGTGAYFAIFDDDDLVLASWVASFHDASRAAPGRVLRTVVVDQACVREPWGESEGLVASSRPSPSYQTRFSLLDHVVGGATPISAFALPRRVFYGLDYRFDENINVHEDWDLQVRAIQYLGVYSREVVTGIYRRHPESDSLVEFPTETRDVIFDTIVRHRVTDQIFLIEGNELLSYRSNAKLIDELWHAKEAVLTERNAIFVEKESEAASKEAREADVAALEKEVEFLKTFEGSREHYKTHARERLRLRVKNLVPPFVRRRPTNHG